MSLIAPSLQAYFTDRLIRERRVSPHTIRSYRDTIRLLVGFAAQRAGTAASRLTFDDLDAKTVGAFLDHLEQQRGCTPRTRNTRLAGDPLVLPLRRLGTPRARRHDRAGARDPAQAHRPTARDMAPEARAPSAACRAGPADMDRAA